MSAVELAAGVEVEGTGASVRGAATRLVGGPPHTSQLYYGTRVALNTLAMSKVVLKVIMSRRWGMLRE